MKKLGAFVRHHALILALVGVLLIIGVGIFLTFRAHKEIAKLEDSIRTSYQDLKKYRTDPGNAPSPELISRLNRERAEWERAFSTLVRAFSTQYPEPPTWSVFPQIEFKEYLFATQDYLVKKARRKRVVIPASFGFPETGLQTDDQIRTYCLQIDIIKRLTDLVIDSGVSVVNNITPGTEQNVSFYKVVPLQITITGTSMEVVRFLKYLENPSSFFVINSMAVAQSGAPGLFRADLSLSAVILQQPQAPSASAQPEGM